jgi:hypothetical protein
MDYSKLSEHWVMFFLSPCRARASILRPLWYKIQCELLSIKLQDKYITRLNKYIKNGPAIAVKKANKNKYDLKSGTQIIRFLKGVEHKIIIKGPKELEYKGKQYQTLSAVAKVICGKKVSGPDFFGLYK